MLAQYIAEVQRLLNDEGGQFFKIPTLTAYINRARRRIAAISGCIRCLPPGLLTHKGQERYPFSHMIPIIQQEVPGAGEVLFVRSLSIAQGRGPGAWAPQWYQIPFTDFSARFRVLDRTFLGNFNVPGWFAVFGSGPAAELYLAPIPMREDRMLLDLTLLPTPLIEDSDDPCPLPYPWSDVVAFWAGVMALLQQQRKEDAKVLSDLFTQMMPECAAVVMPQFNVNSYAPGHIRSA